MQIISYVLYLELSAAPSSYNYSKVEVGLALFEMVNTSTHSQTFLEIYRIVFIDISSFAVDSSNFQNLSEKKTGKFSNCNLGC